MKCPKCSSAFEKVSVASDEVDRCTSCRGLWFQVQSVERLRSVEGSEAIDIGDPELGKQFDSKDRIECPECHTPMIRMVDGEQPHIHFESCKVCYGIFLDAGEFTDLKHKSVLDYLRDLLARERT